MNIALILGVAVGVSAPALKLPPKSEPNIVGVWAIESMTMGGKQPPVAAADVRYEFTADGKWVTHLGPGGKGAAKALPAREYKVDAKKNPSTIDITAGRGPATGMAGIYKLDGDTLTMCLSMTGGDRPTAFESPDGSRVVLMVLKRVKPKE
jgi:uncharacterized protein (TIGR03067 family)